MTITGIVQGVGFRPHVFRLAQRLAIQGFVANDSRGVIIEAEGEADALCSFERELRSAPPPQAWIESFTVEPMEPVGAVDFVIHQSAWRSGERTPVSPDLATCPECVAELFDPANRRYRYPFLNCTNCGPRFTIIRDLPYDRPQTTMAAFEMCPACRAEYDDPADRRFHAQPNACPVCGPQVWLHSSGVRGGAAIEAVLARMAAGEIVALKGIGGFHLACDATQEAAVGELRRRKGRVDKPFALLVATIEDARRLALVDEDEATLLESRERPIVLVRKRPGSMVSELVAPGHSHLGLLLPYSPLHHLIASERPLVLTSGNRSDEPIARSNEEALTRLSDLADDFLLHDREIQVVCDDSVVRVWQGHELPVRRSRGYAPLPVRLPAAGPSVLAVGGEMKAAFCLTRGGRAFVSQHVGDMENLETLEAFERALAQMKRLVGTTPERAACDLHPGYLSSRWARAAGWPVVEVQHHHAHVASLMAEAGLNGSEPVIGVAFDGTGYGLDGAIWGGEFLLADYRGFKRLAHLKYVPMAGGDASVRRTYRMALTHLRAAGLEWEESLACVQAASAAERTVVERGVNAVPTSSMGRLFDAAASLAGLRQVVNYEGQGAMEFEAAADASSLGSYEFGCSEGLVDPAPLWRAFLADGRAGVGLGTLSMRFHRAVAGMILNVCRQAGGASTVALTGGTFQNTLLLELTVPLLERAGFRVLTHRRVPTNDGGLALGQALVALH